MCISFSWKHTHEQQLQKQLPPKQQQPQSVQQALFILLQRIWLYAIKNPTAEAGQKVTEHYRTS